MLQNRLHLATLPLLTLRSSGSHVPACGIVTNAFSGYSNATQISAHHISNPPLAATNGLNIKTFFENAINSSNERNRCAACERVFTDDPLSKRSKRTCICVGCRRLYAQCRNDLDMRLIKSIQTFKFGHGDYSHEIMPRHMITQHKNYFTTNKFRPSMQADFHVLTEMAECWDQGVLMTDLEFRGDIWNDQHLDLSTLLTLRASRFLHHTKERYRKLFPDAKLANEKFKFPTQSQLKGFMEASNGICSWSGLHGHWRPNRASPLLLLSIDHIVPVSKHGSPNMSNLQVVLSVYNSVKSNESESEFKRWLYFS
ncbi:hypothetical protein MBANPS3_008525 [Mucor bainieri]